MMTEYFEAASKFTQQTQGPFDVKSHLDMYIEMEMKVVELLELLRASKIKVNDFTKIRSKNDGHDHDNIDS